MSDPLMALARGQNCTVRIPSVCNGNPETTVAAHLRSHRLGAGIGIRPSPLFCAWACSACHDAIDGRTRTNYTKADLTHLHVLGVLETQKWLLDNGYISLRKDGK